MLSKIINYLEKEDGVSFDEFYRLLVDCETDTSDSKRMLVNFSDEDKVTIFLEGVIKKNSGILYRKFDHWSVGKKNIKLAQLILEKGHFEINDEMGYCYESYLELCVYLLNYCRSNFSFVLIDIIQKYILILSKVASRELDNFSQKNFVLEILKSLCDLLLHNTPVLNETFLNPFSSLELNEKKGLNRSRVKVAIIAGNSSSTAKILCNEISQLYYCDIVVLKIKNDLYKKIYPTFTSAFYPHTKVSYKKEGFTSITNTFPIEDFKTENSNILINYLKNNTFDIGIVAGCGYLPNTVIDNFVHGVINIHNGILPNYRGMDSIGWSLLRHGLCGFTLHFINKDIDSGSVLECKLFERPFTKSNIKNQMISSIKRALSAISVNGNLPVGRKQNVKYPIYFQMGGLLRMYLKSKLSEK